MTCILTATDDLNDLSTLTLPPSIFAHRSMVESSPHIVKLDMKEIKTSLPQTEAEKETALKKKMEEDDFEDDPDCPPLE